MAKHEDEEEGSNLKFASRKLIKGQEVYLPHMERESYKVLDGYDIIEACLC